MNWLTGSTGWNICTIQDLLIENGISITRERYDLIELDKNEINP
jgi:hypothetical protein